MNSQKLKAAIAAFIKNKKANAAYYDDNWTDRKERKAYYQSFTKDKLLVTSKNQHILCFKRPNIFFEANSPIKWNDFGLSAPLWKSISRE